MKTFEAAQVDTGAVVAEAADTAHADTAVQGLAVQPDGSHAGKLLLAVGATLSIVILAMLVIWQVFDYAVRKEQRVKNMTRASHALTALRESQRKAATDYYKVGAQVQGLPSPITGLRGRYRVPVARAIDILIAQPHRIRSRRKREPAVGGDSNDI